MDKKEVGKRLKEIRNKRGQGIEDVAKKLNVSKSTISMWENGHRIPDVFTLMEYSTIYGVDINSFLGSELKSDNINTSYANSDIIKIPIIGEVKAGYDLLAEQNIVGYSYVAKATLNGGDYFYLKVQGDSMTGADISEGDLLLVRRQPAVDEGQIAVVLLENNEATVKRLYYKGEQVILHSENPKYPPKLVDYKEIKVLGLVKQITKQAK